MNPAAPSRLAIALSLLAAGCTDRAPLPCTIAAAASLRPLVEDLARDLAAADPPLAVELVTAATATLAAQIRHGAPFALLLAADETTTQALVADGRAAAADAFAFARGSLCLWTAADRSAALQQRGLAALAEGNLAHLAIANPEVAPYGRAALQALERAGVLTTLTARLVRAENAAQCAHFARSGAVDAALLPPALAAGLAGHRWPVPATLHEPIVYSGLLLAHDSVRRAAAQRVAAWLRSPRGRAALAAHGLQSPE